MTFSSIYTHIPFCVSKCNYCDFISFPVDNHHSQLRKYASLLDKDMAKWALREDFSQVETVYFGGGTPTVLATGDLLHLVSGISSMCNLQEDNEFTIECNPGTIDERNLLRLRQSGVNRLSVGAESFNDQVLQYMGRIYRAEDCLKLLKNARHAGFDNLSIDLIYGLPGQTVEQWLEDLNRALDLDIDHISVYGLTIPDNTPWGKAVAAGRMQMPDIDISADMLEISIKSIKEAGFEHYEVSNFAKKGHRCRHNMGYWQRNDYLGLGVAAASASGNHRWCNYRNLQDYEDCIQDNRLPLEDEERLTDKQVYSEAMFLGLRLLDGVNKEDFFKKYGVHPQKIFAAAIDKMIGFGLLEDTGACLRLTHRGLFLANEVFMSFL